MRLILSILVLCVVGVMAYVRFAPTKTEQVNVAGAARDPGDHPQVNGFTAVRAIKVSPEEALRAIESVALQTPRTTLIPGAVSDGLMTFETRSRMMGYPDYTTVSVIPTNAAPGGNDAPLVMIHGRLRFGRSDLGVNQARIKAWLAQLGSVVAAP